MKLGYHQFYFTHSRKGGICVTKYTGGLAEEEWAVCTRYWQGRCEHPQVSSQPDPPFIPALPAVPREARPGELTPLSHRLCPGLFTYFGS